MELKPILTEKLNANKEADSVQNPQSKSTIIRDPPAANTQPGEGFDGEKGGQGKTAYSPESNKVPEWVLLGREDDIAREEERKIDLQEELERNSWKNKMSMAFSNLKRKCEGCSAILQVCLLSSLVCLAFCVGVYVLFGTLIILPMITFRYYEFFMAEFKNSCRMAIFIWIMSLTGIGGGASSYSSRRENQDSRLCDLMNAILQIAVFICEIIYATTMRANADKVRENTGNGTLYYLFMWYCDLIVYIYQLLLLAALVICVGIVCLLIRGYCNRY